VAKGTWLIFLKSGVERLLTWLGIKLITLDLGFQQSSAFDHSAMVIPLQ